MVSGPPPDPNALRRNRPSDKAGWTTLPAEGRKGPVPEWPLVSPAERELDLWEDHWSMPQAVMWEALGQQYEVAMYVRCMAEAERIDGRIDVKKLVRQYADSLGLSVQGMQRNRWKVGPIAEETPEDSGKTQRPLRRRPGPRDRLKVVPSGEGA